MPNYQLVCEMNFSASSKEPQASACLHPQQSEWNHNFCSSNLFYLHLKSGLFPQRNPASASTQRKHSWRQWNSLICWWRWGGLAVDHWLVKTFFLQSCELPIFLKMMLPSLMSLRTECKTHLFGFALLKYPTNAHTTPQAHLCPHGVPSDPPFCNSWYLRIRCLDPRLILPSLLIH